MQKKKQNKQYADMTKAASPNSPCAVNCLKAFLIGGAICVIGEILKTLYAIKIEDEKTVGTLVSVSLVALAAILTGIGVFDKIAKHAGAGTLVPITGFANAVVSPALEFKTEGHILGTAVNMFSIAGPVIVFGTAAATLYGVIYWITTLF
ncbi:MAG: stage V sporulation protein AC [Ruminococcaceae bacterium]|nr:stage V sporulation protein AC [Oscillospiraceae bacterium]